LIGQLFRQLIG
jgi:hypothetical protein